MKIQLGVFFGGRSVEHEVSIISALQACNALDREKYDVIPIYINKQNEMYVGEKIGKIEEYSDIPKLLKASQRIVLINENGQIKMLRYPLKRFGESILGTIDIAFPIVHGTNVEDGTLAGYLHMLDVPYVGCDVLSSAVGMDKFVMKTVLEHHGLPVLPCVCVTAKEYSEKNESIIDEIEKKVGYPVIVKPINLGSSVGIRKAVSRSALEDAMDNALLFANKVLVERAIMNLKEINCSVLGDTDDAEASECEEPIANDEILSYEDKYVSGGKSGKSGGMASLKRKIPADISSETREKIRKLAVAAFKYLGCSGVARIDFMIDNDNGDIYFNEINTIPGSLSFYLWEPIGMKYSALLDRMIELALKRERDNSALNFSFETNILAGMTFGGAKGGKFGGK